MDFFKLSLNYILVIFYYTSFVLCHHGSKSSDRFPDSFKFGTATSAYQIEGAWNASGKNDSIWDYYIHTFPHLIEDGSNADIACDSYHKIDEDIEMLKHLNVDFYRFSINWPRLLPFASDNYINPDGVRYYNELIDKLIANGIEPVITLYHWELPQIIQDFGGWTNHLVVQYFAQFARVCFTLFGNRVKTWITINEPYSVCAYSYEDGFLAPFIIRKGIGSYLCGHNVLLAHAAAYHIYKDEFYSTQRGQVGIALETTWYAPFNSQSVEDQEAASRALQYHFDWFAHPIFAPQGGYPPIMRQRIDEYSERQGYKTSRLPYFTRTETAYIRNSADFLGLQHYTSFLVTPEAPEDVPARTPNMINDFNTRLLFNRAWNNTARDVFKVYPEGIRYVLNYIKNKYENPPVLITENGYAGDKEETTDDEPRIWYYRGYLKETLKALNDGCNILGYTAWSLMDNFEWSSGYSLRFGLFYVDFDDANRARTPKKSALWYKNVINTREIN